MSAVNILFFGPYCYSKVLKLVEFILATKNSIFNPMTTPYVRPIFRSEKPQLPYSIGHFEAIREENYFYIDKTEYIRTLEAFKVPVFLRPRRFGKTLWCSTLECYYDILRTERFEFLFGDLEIGKNPTGMQNSMMVLRMNFSTIQVDFDMNQMERTFKSHIFSNIQNFLDRYEVFFKNQLTIDESLPISKTLDMVVDFIAKNNLPPMYLIIDEYDNFVNQFITGRQDHLYKEITTGDSFFRTFFKAVKAGVESRSIGRVFITGVLPITMDDLTSGFNIAEIVTLEPDLHGMLGFTENEVSSYLDQVIQVYEIEPSLKVPTLNLMRNYYNGYKFLKDASESLYNSTISTYFLKYFALHRGEAPSDMIDPNVKTDVSWIERLSYDEGSPQELMDSLLNDNSLEYNIRTLSDRFSMDRFFDSDHYPASLFFLGMLTVKDSSTLYFPNQTLIEIFADYYNKLYKINTNKGYGIHFKEFLKNLEMGALFQAYWTVYIGQIPAQAFDKMNENFFRTSFFELCSRYISHQFSFGIEVNYTSGRCDFEMLGRPEGLYKNQKWMIEFKYLTNKVKMENLLHATPEDVAQIEGYKTDSLVIFPEHTIKTAVCYIVGNQGFKWFDN